MQNIQNRHLSNLFANYFYDFKKSAEFIVKRWRGNEKSLQQAGRSYFARFSDSGIRIERSAP
ncbi:MAG: hypothetical protein WEB02_04505 [Methylophaga sp.]